MKKGKIFWLSRDLGYLANNGYTYNIFMKKKYATMDSEGIFENYIFEMCDEKFERATGIKLKPGEGPVKCRLILED